MLSFYSKPRAEEIQKGVAGAMKQGMVESINYTFRYAAGVAGFGALVAFALRDARKKGKKARS
jgi:hypothetical protein